MIVIASYYALFAVMGGSGRALAIESIAIGAFLLRGFCRGQEFVPTDACRRESQNQHEPPSYPARRR